MPIFYPNFARSSVWYTSADSEEQNGDDVIIYADNPYQEDLVMIVEPNAGDVQIQVKDSSDNWFTPTGSEFTITEKTLVKIPRKNMPDTRILATSDATFCIHGSV